MKRTENEATRYQTFEDLDVYQIAREFRKARGRVAGDSSRVREASSDDDLNPDDLKDLLFGRFNPSSVQHFIG
jgi:hypothetical protein